MLRFLRGEVKMGSCNIILFCVDAIEGQICLNRLLLFFVCHLQLTNFGGFPQNLPINSFGSIGKMDSIYRGETGETGS